MDIVKPNKTDELYIPVLEGKKLVSKRVHLFHSWIMLTPAGPVVMCSLTNGIRILYSNLLKVDTGTQVELRSLMSKIMCSMYTYFRTEAVINDNEYKVKTSIFEVKRFLLGFDLPIIYKD